MVVSLSVGLTLLSLTLAKLLSVTLVVDKVLGVEVALVSVIVGVIVAVVSYTVGNADENIFIESVNRLTAVSDNNSS